MTSEKKSFLLGQLQEAIDEAVSKSGRVAEIVDEMRRSGYDLTLMLESTVTVSPSDGQRPDVVSKAWHATGGEIELTDEDREFLHQLKVAA